MKVIDFIIILGVVACLAIWYHFNVAEKKVTTPVPAPLPPPDFYLPPMPTTPTPPPTPQPEPPACTNATLVQDRTVLTPYGYATCKKSGAIIEEQNPNNPTGRVIAFTFDPTYSYYTTENRWTSWIYVVPDTPTRFTFNNSINNG